MQTITFTEFVEYWPFVIFHFAPLIVFLIVGAIVLAVFWRRRWRLWLTVAGGLCGLLLIGMWHAHISWRVIPATLIGYQYDPRRQIPNPHMVPTPPDEQLARQLTRLLGQTGPSPLHPTSPLVDFEIERVALNSWLEYSATATIQLTLAFENGESRSAEIEMGSGGGGYELLWDVELRTGTRHWFVESTEIGRIIQSLPIAYTSISHTDPPFTLTPHYSFDVVNLTTSVNNNSFVSVSDIDASGAALLYVDLRDGQTKIGNALLHINAAGESAEFRRSTRVGRSEFSPSGQQIAFIDSDNEREFWLYSGTLTDGFEKQARAHWQSFGWLTEDSLFYQYKNTLYYQTPKHTRAVIRLEQQGDHTNDHYNPHGPSGRLAISDFAERVSIYDPDFDARFPLGWGGYAAGWGPHLLWRADGQKLFWAEMDRVTGKPHLKLWVYDWQLKESILVAQLPQTFRPSPLCWVDAEHVLVESVRNHEPLLLVNVNSGELWALDNVDSTFTSSTCAHGYVALHNSGTSMTIYQIRANQ